LKHDKRDADCTGEAAKYKEIEYPAPDGKLTFDLLTNLQRSGTYHADDQPAHLRIKPEKASIPKDVSLQTYGGPEQRFCPAAVYEYVDADDDSDSGSADKRKQLVINAQNCVHCKCCSIKMPDEYINWTVPEGGGGPQYQVM
jgi:electron-transferring-flavoprotein dehydrogenase